jgi:hypothetical protein
LKVYLIAFRGMNELHNPENREPALVKVGHVGLRFEDDERIFGFSPSKEALDTAGSEQALIEKLKNNEPQAGCVRDDTAIFKRAYELNQQGNKRTEVFYLLCADLPEIEYSRVKAQVLEWYNTQKSMAWYNFPQKRGASENVCKSRRRLRG